MKIYTSKNEKKIAYLEQANQKLREENEFLKEQLAACNPENTNKKLELTEKTRLKYEELLYECVEIKKEYNELIKEMSSMKASFKKDLEKMF